MTLVIVKYILNLTRSATVKLQSEEMDILKAEQEFATLQNALEDMQKNIEGHHHRLFEEAVQLSQNVGIQPSRPRIVQRQIFRSNCPASTPCRSILSDQPYASVFGPLLAATSIKISSRSLCVF